MEASGGDLTSSDANRVTATLLSGSAFRDWGWGLNYDKQKTDYKSAQSFDTELVGANARFHVSHMSNRMIPLLPGFVVERLKRLWGWFLIAEFEKPKV